MLKLIHGENYYLSHKRLKEIKNSSKEVEFAFIDGDYINDVGEIFVSGQSFGMFKTSTVTIVKRFFKNPKKISLEKKIIERLQKEDVKSIDLIFWEDEDIYATRRKSKPKKPAKDTVAKKPRATSKLDTFLKNFAEIEENKNLTPIQIEKWIMDGLTKNGIKASLSCVQAIVKRVGTSQALLDEELNKLSLYLNSEKRKDLTIKDVEFVTSFYQQDYKIWDLTDAFFNKNQKKALEILDILLVNPQQDFPMIIGAVLKQIKTIYLVSKYKHDTRTVMSKLRMMPFMFYKAENLARNISPKMLKLMYQKFIDLDYSIKQGKIDVRLGLDLLIMTLSR
jgi:DNA polymerase III delta subunit